MAETIDVYNDSSGSEIVVGGHRISSGASYSFNRKQIIIGHYPDSTYDPALYADLLNLVGSTTAVARVMYNGVALTAATLANLTQVDTTAGGQVFTESYTFDDGGLGAAVGPELVFIAPFACRILSVTHTDIVGITADNTNYATFAIVDDTGSNTLATGTTEITGLGDFTQYVPMAITLSTTVADLDLAAASAVSLEITKAAAGVAVHGVLQIQYEALIS